MQSKLKPYYLFLLVVIMAIGLAVVGQLLTWKAQEKGMTFSPTDQSHEPLPDRDTYTITTVTSPVFDQAIRPAGFSYNHWERGLREATTLFVLAFTAPVFMGHLFFARSLFRISIPPVSVVPVYILHRKLLL